MKTENTLDAVAEELSARHAKRFGFAYSAHQSRFVGIAPGLEHGYVVTAAELAEATTAAELIAGVTSYSDMFSAATDIIGGWFNGVTYTIEHSTLFASKSAAAAAAVNRGMSCVHDLWTEDCVDAPNCANCGDRDLDDSDKDAKFWRRYVYGY